MRIASRVRPLCIAVIFIAASLAAGQQPRQVNDALLKTGSVSGEEWVATSVIAVSGGPSATDGRGAAAPWTAILPGVGCSAAELTDRRQ